MKEFSALAVFVVLLACACALENCSIDPPNQCKWYNGSFSDDERVQALVNAMTTEEKLHVVSGGSCERLHVYADGFNEAAHGVAWTGRATVFPCSMGMASTWNVSLVEKMGQVVQKEALAKHWGDNSNALSFFAPNINIVRDPRYVEI